jgi:hypothetical protein
MDNILKSQTKIYRENFIKHGDTPKGTFQNNLVTIEERHRQLISNLLPFLPENFTLCDLGSGTSDLHGYLLNNGIGHQYTGIEIVPEMIEASMSKYPGIRVLNCNILNEKFVEKFDVIVVSGTFNMKGEMDSQLWEEYVLAVISKMFSLANIAITYNAITSYSDFREESLYYMSPEKAINYAQNKLSRFFCFSTLWPLYEFNLTVFKPEAIAKIYSHKEFSKYFQDETISKFI